MEMQKLYLLVPLAPLVGAIIAGLFCRVIPRWVAHTVTIAGVAIAFVASYRSSRTCRPATPSTARCTRG
jgi:NADH-quinone oxidoreductase subunit L